MLNSKYFLLILSHQKSVYRENQLKSLRAQKRFDDFIIYYFIGKPNLESDYIIDDDNKIVYLKTPDNYEGLPLKTLKSLNFIESKYTDIIKGVFKTDDDIEIDLERLFDVLELNSKEKYFGSVTVNKEPKSSYHFGKCENETLNILIIDDLPINLSYCSGGGYFINNSIIKEITKNDESFYKIMYEDLAMGKCISDLGYQPKNVDIRKECCKWVDDIFYDLDFDLNNLPPNKKLKLILSDQFGNFENSSTLIESIQQVPLRLRFPPTINLEDPDCQYRLKLRVYE